jgi:hypothetical protein
MAQYPLVPRPGGSNSLLNITAATVVKATPGTLFNISVTVAGSAAGSASDVATTGGVAAANKIFDIPNTVGSYVLTWPCKVGIVITPGTGQTVSVAYS